MPALLSFCSFSVCGDGRVSPGRAPHPAAHPGGGLGVWGGPYKVLEFADQPLLGTVPGQERFAARREDVELAKPAGQRREVGEGRDPWEGLWGGSRPPWDADGGRDSPRDGRCGSGYPSGAVGSLGVPPPALSQLSPCDVGWVPARHKGGSGAVGPPGVVGGGLREGATCRCGSWPPCGGCGRAASPGAGHGLRICWRCGARAGASRGWGCWAAAPPRRHWGKKGVRTALRPSCAALTS